MKPTRRVKADTVAGQVAAHQKPLEEICWPGEVTQLSLPADRKAANIHFKKILTARATEFWRATDIVAASQLAILQVHYNKIAVQLDEDGFITDDCRRSPTFDVLERLLGKIAQLSRTLSLVGMPVAKATLENAKRAEDKVKEARRANKPHMSLLA